METNSKNNLDPRIEELLAAGAHFGMTRTRRHPSTKSFILGSKQKSDIIDLEKTLEGIDKAKAYLAEVVGKGKKILLVGTKPEVRAIVARVAEGSGALSMKERWAGGLLTNFSEIKKRIDRLDFLRKGLASGSLNKYTKKERGLLEREEKRLSLLFGGVAGMTELPGALVVIDAAHEETAVREAKKLGIGIVAITSTDTNISPITYPILANDSSVSSVETILKMLFGKN